MKNLHPKAQTLFLLNNLLGLFVVFGGGYFWLLIIPAPETSTSLLSNYWESFLVFGLAAIFLLSWLFAWLGYINYKYELGDLGFRKEYGVIWKRYVMIPYSRIQNIDIHRGILARTLGLSDIMIQTAGNSGQYGVSEGRLPAIGKDEAMSLRDELLKRVTEPISKQGL
ncbi:MAG: PH domain-containing protein [bacterium]|nr:PH domain-containing protein [bacterium]